jgi:hypothetical protein
VNSAARRIRAATVRVEGQPYPARPQNNRPPRITNVMAIFFCKTPSSGSWGATGSFPSLTPGSFTADVYRAAAGSLSEAKAGATVYNYFPASPAVSKVVEVFSDGQGNFITGPQSCT